MPAPPSTAPPPPKAAAGSAPLAAAIDRELAAAPTPFRVVDPELDPPPDFDEQARQILDRAQQATGFADFARSRSHGSVRASLAHGDVTFDEACLIVDRLGQDVRAAGTKPSSLFKLFSDHSQRDFYLRVWTPPTPSEIRPDQQTFAERDKANYQAEVRRHIAEFAAREEATKPKSWSAS